MAAQFLSVEDFIDRLRHVPAVDVRSENEYAKGRIPGALNLPLLDNEARIKVGTTYKQKGREEAVLTGFELTGPKFGAFIKQARSMAPGKEILIYCWRGGMRSHIMSWVLELAGFRTYVLKGGYKTFRRWTLSTLQQPRNLVILGGMTGSGKTELIQQMAKQGAITIDLEALACHKGSAFGALGQHPQPSNEHFENMLAMEWLRTADAPCIWVENESRTIGSNKIPDCIYNLMRAAPVVELVVPFETRLQRILSEYGSFPAEQLAEKTGKLKKRLGDLRVREAINFLNQGNTEGWGRILLTYYDKLYAFGMSLRNPENTFGIEITSQDYKENAKKVMRLLQDIQARVSTPTALPGSTG